MRLVSALAGVTVISSLSRLAGRSFTGSATLTPATQTISPAAATRGRWGLSHRGIFASTRKSWSFFGPGAPWGQKRSPGSPEARAIRGRETRSASSQAVSGGGQGSSARQARRVQLPAPAGGRLHFPRAVRQPGGLPGRRRQGLHNMQDRARPRHLDVFLSPSEIRPPLRSLPARARRDVHLGGREAHLRADSGHP